MKIDKSLLFGVLIGMALGLVLAAETMHLASDRTCPGNICLGASEIVPVSDKGYFPKVHEALLNAKKSIHIAAFELKYYSNYKNSSENTIIDDIISAHERGVDVKIVLDQYSAQDNATNAYFYLKKKGVPVRYDSDKTTTHAKLVIIDGKVVVLGSTNFSYTSLELNNEVDVVLFSEEAARYFEQYFQKLWAG